MNTASKELKKLSRRELVDIIYQLKRNEEELLEENESLKNELEDKKIKLSSAGSVAEAAMAITDIFSAAQNTADTYLDEINDMKQTVQKECDEKIEEAEERVRAVLAKGKEKILELRAIYARDYAKWLELKKEIEKLEQKENLCEDNENV